MRLFAEFLATIERLDIQSSYMQGRVAVIGQAQFFPERSLLCDDENFEHLKPDISLLVCLDPEFFTEPDQWLDRPSIKSSKTKTIQTLPHGSVVYHAYGAKAIFDGTAWNTQPYPDNFFQTVMAFQVQELGEQLHDGLLSSIVRVLKPGGIFIGSGDSYKNFYDSFPNESYGNIHLLQQVNLPNPGYSGYPFNEHVGVIFQKK